MKRFWVSEKEQKKKQINTEYIKECIERFFFFVLRINKKKFCLNGLFCVLPFVKKKYRSSIDEVALIVFELKDFLAFCPRLEC